MTTLSRLSLTASVLCMLAAPMLATGARAESKATGSATPAAATQVAGAQSPANGKAAVPTRPANPAHASVVIPSGTNGKAAPEAKGKANGAQAGSAQPGRVGTPTTPATTVR